MPQIVTDPSQSEIDDFVAQWRSNQANAKAPSHDDDDIDAFVRNFRAQKVADSSPTAPAQPELTSSPIVPFRPPVATEPLDVRAARLGAPMIPLGPPSVDTSQVPLNVFTNRPQALGMATAEESQRGGGLDAAPQTVSGRIARAVGAGSPEGSELANLTGQVGTKGDIGPRVQDLMTESEQQQHPIYTGAGEFASGLLSPEGVMMLAGTAGAGELAGPAGQTVRQLMAAGFTAQMVSDAASTVPDISAAIQRGDSYTAKRLMTRAALTAGLGGLAGRGMFEGEGATQPGYSRVADSDTLASRKAAGMVGPSEEPLTPESNATLKAQVDALSRGTNPVVYFPAGHETLPTPPENAQVTVVPGEQAGAGVYYHDDSITPDQVRQSVADGSFGQLLGNLQTKHEAILGGSPAAVVARGADGGEVKASLVDGRNPQAIAKQAAALARQFPDAEIGLERPDDVVSGRQGSGTKTGSNVAETAASPETPQAGEGDADDIHDFVRNYRATKGTEQSVANVFGQPGEDEIDAFVRTRREAESIVAPQRQELTSLASQLDQVDAHTADALRGLADASYFSRDDLLKIAGGVKNEAVAKNLKSIVDGFNARAGRATEESGDFVGESRPKTSSANADERPFAPNSVSENAGSVRSSAEDVRSLPSEGRDQLGPQPAPAKVGDRVVATSGPHKGKTIEVTKVGATGIYGEDEGGSPIRFLKTGDFSVSPELTSGRTFFANPISTALGEGSRILSRAWEQKVARPLIDRVLKIGDKYQDIREEDPAMAEGLHLLDNAPTYLREKAAHHVQDVVGNLSRGQERLFSLMADADSRENLRTNHPTEYQQAKSDPAIQQALRRYKPLEQELTAIRERLGGQNLDQDYLRRVYDKYVAGVNSRNAAGGATEAAPSYFDRVIRPQKVNTKSRQATAEYHYQNGLHEFGPAFGTKYIASHLKSLRDEVAQEFLSKATEVSHGSPEPTSISYEGRRYYRPDLARDARESGRKDVREYGVYNPSEGERFPMPAEAKFIGPKAIVDTLRNYGGKESSAPGALHRFFQEQILGFGFGIPHAFNILRRVTQTSAGGATNPVAWVRALKVALSKNLRDRGISGLDDPTFDMLAQHGAISTREVSNLKSYIGGNLNPANWMRGLAQVGHKALFDPKSFGGFGGLDQRARLYVADLMRSQRPGLSDAEIARGVGDALGEYGRANWTDRQKMLGRFMTFPGWDFSSFRWVVQHPLKTTLPPAILTLLANRALHSIGQNHGYDQNDISAVHIGDRAYNTSLLRESMARNLFRPAINYAQAKIQGKSNAVALDEAGRGITQGAGGLLSTLRPDLSGFVALATNRENIASGKEIVSKGDYGTPGKILPSRALEKVAAFAVRRAFPAVDRVLDQKGDVDLRSFVGGNLGVPNYRQSAEDRLNKNAAEAQRVMATVSKLSKSDPAAARTFLKDPDNAALALFHNDIASLEGNVKRIDKAKAQVEDSNLADSVKTHRLQALERARQNVLSHADGLDQKLFDKRAAGRRSSGPVPFWPPGTY
jgi:hypothetical protein